MLSHIFIGCFLAFSQDITLTETIKTAPATFVAVTAQTKGLDVVFVTLDPGLSVFPSNLLVDKKTTVVVAPKEGRYRILAYTSIDNKPSQPAYTTIVVGNPPPDPDPVPNPKPPRPPTPPPPPDSPLATTIKSIYGGLQESDKSVNVKRLGQVYELAVVEADNAQYKTLGQLYGSIRSAAIQSIKNDKIVPIREAIANELDNFLGTDGSKPLDASTRANCKAAFKLVATILGEING